MPLSLRLALLAVLTPFAPTARAEPVRVPEPLSEPIPIPNFSFEDEKAKGDGENGAIYGFPHWKATSTPSPRKPKTAFAYILDPGREFSAQGDRPLPGAHSAQCLVIATLGSLQSEKPLLNLEAGATYTLKVALGDAKGKREPGRIQVGFLVGDEVGGFNPTGDAHFVDAHFVDAHFGDLPPAETKAPQHTVTFDATDFTPEGTFKDLNLAFTASGAEAGKPLKIFVAVLTFKGIIWLDNFRLEKSGPEKTLLDKTPSTKPIQKSN